MGLLEPLEYKDLQAQQVQQEYKAHKEIRALLVQAQPVQVAQPAHKEHKDLLEQLVQAQPAPMAQPEQLDCPGQLDYKDRQEQQAPLDYEDPPVRQEQQEQAPLALAEQPALRAQPELQDLLVLLE